MAPFVALTGFMGSGKSSVGEQVARRLGWRFLDLDEEFVREQGCSIADFFAREGEEKFRARECALLSDVVSSQPAHSGLVIALGGGTLESADAAELMATTGGVVFLDVDADEAWSRVAGTGRPLATDEAAFRQLLDRRRSTYLDAADWVLPVGDRSVEQLADEIAGIVTDTGARWSSMWGRRLACTTRPSLIVGGDGALSSLEPRAARIRQSGRRIFVVSDKNVMDAWGDRVAALLAGGRDAPLVLQPGESSKSVAMLQRCWDWLAGNRARRDDVVIALGGGVVGDLTGFAAATYQRGVELWQVPTSLIAHIDSSIGGKTAVNLRSGKNLVGAFYQPDVVVGDPTTLQTLPQAEFQAGLGEVVKYGLLISAPFFDSLARQADRIARRDAQAVGMLLKPCISYKVAVVEEDEHENGRRAVLNLGHTVAHAFEVVAGYGSIPHGHAVGLGLLVALAVSEQVLGLDASVRERTRALLKEFGLPTRASLAPADRLLAATRIDKKARAGTKGFVGLKEIGVPVWGLDVPDKIFNQALEVIKQ